MSFGGEGSVPLCRRCRFCHAYICRPPGCLLLPRLAFLRLHPHRGKPNVSSTTNHQREPLVTTNSSWKKLSATRSPFYKFDGGHFDAGIEMAFEDECSIGKFGYEERKQDRLPCHWASFCLFSPWKPYLREVAKWSLDIGITQRYNSSETRPHTYHPMVVSTPCCHTPIVLQWKTTSFRRKCNSGKSARRTNPAVYEKDIFSDCTVEEEEPYKLLPPAFQ